MNMRTRTTQVWAGSAPSGVVRFLVVFTSNLQSSQRGPLFGESSPERGNDRGGGRTRVSDCLGHEVGTGLR